MFKRCTIIFTLVLVLVIGLLPMTARAATLDNGLVYEIYEDHVVITGYAGKAAEIVIPNEIQGFPVTYIASMAFSECQSLTRVTLPDGLTRIGENAFSGCANLGEVVIPDGVTQIGGGAFYDCDRLTAIYIPASTKSIDDNTFAYCDSLISIEVDPQNPSYCSRDDVVYTKDMSMLLCWPAGKQGSFTIPASVSRIEYNTFGGCHALTDILVEEGSENFTSEDGILYNKDMTQLIRCPGGKLGHVTLPASVESLDHHSFEYCTGMTSIDLPDGLESIQPGAFSGCTGLTSISIPEGAYVSFSVFSGCTGLTSVHLPNSARTLSEGVFSKCTSLTEITIPDSVEFIAFAAFSKCSSLTEITIPDSVELIDFAAFEDCTNLSTIYFKGNAPGFGGEVFQNVTATAYYPADNATWTKDVMQDYGGDITWVPYNPDNPFTDVPEGAYYEEPVLWAVENGITDGVSDTSFAPDDQCLRSQVVTFLHRAAKNPAPSSTRNPFTDVKTGDYFYNPVLWAVEKGITDGVADNLFGSEDVCTRGQVVTFLWRAAGEPKPQSTRNPFEDVNPTDYFYSPVLWALENGITDGTSDTTFAPNATCTRAQVVTFLYRAEN